MSFENLREYYFSEVAKKETTPDDKRTIAVCCALELLARGYVIQENEEKISFAPLNPINKISDLEDRQNLVKEIADDIEAALENSDRNG